MKIRNIVLIPALLLAATGCSLAQTNIVFPTKSWSVTVKIVGEDGQPVSGARVAVAYVKPPYSYSDDPEYNDRILGTTDTNGLCFATHNDRTGSIGFSVNEQGYYTTRSSRTLRDPEENVNDRDISLTLTLKKIGKPIPMYAKQANLGMPVFDKPAGFDLMIGDWVAPYGKGISTDIIFTGHLDQRTEFDSDYKLVVNFPNAGDGIEGFGVPEAEKGSGLRSPHEAPVGGYQSEWIQTERRKPGTPIKTNRDASRNYLFRVRTVLDENGNVKSALYGKIYGDFMQFAYYLNPTLNDRNIEFDPKQNLLDGLKSFEQVTVP